MNRLDNTPPNGDFARYVDDLLRDAERQTKQTAGRQPVAGRKLPTPPANRPAQGAPWAGWRVVRWAIGLWLALQIAAFFYAPLAVVGTPLLLLALVAWGATRLLRRGAFSNLFSTPQWRDLMKQYDKQNPTPAQRTRGK